MVALHFSNFIGVHMETQNSNFQMQKFRKPKFPHSEFRKPKFRIVKNTEKNWKSRRIKLP